MKRKMSKEEKRLHANNEARKRAARKRDSIDVWKGKQAHKARAVESELKTKAKATGKTVAQLIVESWNV